MPNKARRIRLAKWPFVPFCCCFLQILVGPHPVALPGMLRNLNTLLENETGLATEGLNLCIHTLAPSHSLSIHIGFKRRAENPELWWDAWKILKSESRTCPPSSSVSLPFLT